MVYPKLWGTPKTSPIRSRMPATVECDGLPASGSGPVSSHDATSAVLWMPGFGGRPVRAMARSWWRQSRNLRPGASSRSRSDVWSVRVAMTFADMPLSFHLFRNTGYGTAAPVTRGVTGWNTAWCISVSQWAVP